MFDFPPTWFLAVLFALAVIGFGAVVMLVVEFCSHLAWLP